MYANLSRIDPVTGKKKHNLSRTFFIIMCITLPIIHWLVFYVYVNLNSFLMAFQIIDGEKMLYGFKNFERFFQEFRNPTSLIVLGLKNTAKSYLMSVLIFLSGFMVSFFLYKKILFHKAFRIIFFLPGIIAGTIVSSVFSNIVGVDGPVVKIIQWLSGVSEDLDLLHDSRYANSVIFVNMFIFGFASNMVLWGGAFSRIPISVTEAAKLDGVGWFREVCMITIPLVWPTFALNLILNICGFFAASGNVFLLTRGEYGTMTLNCWMYLQVLDQHNDGNALRYMSAVGLLLTVVSIGVSLTVRHFTNKAFSDLQY